MFDTGVLNINMNYQVLGEQVARLRKLQKRSQQNLTVAVGISRATLNALKKDRSVEIEIRNMMSVLQYFNHELCVK